MLPFYTIYLIHTGWLYKTKVTQYVHSSGIGIPYNFRTGVRHQNVHRNDVQDVYRKLQVTILVSCLVDYEIMTANSNCISLLKRSRAGTNTC